MTEKREDGGAMQSSEPFFLSKAAAIEAARKAWNENRLGCQDDNTTRCRYRYPNGRVCAIGVSLPDDLAKSADGRLPMGLSVGAMGRHGMITTDDGYALDQLQSAHDAICYARNGSNALTVQEAFVRFCDLIGVEPPLASATSSSRGTI